ncbi:MAG: RagB/SusD family nutrient uptake outer membrane protein, partial [Prevotella pleuritidis]|nr:RagB/SusD family nutrient uptake outer membrane protein [Hoylesella pleuritidis]
LANDAAVKNYLGEAYFFRALCYFRLLVRFGDMPIVKEVLPDENNTIVANSIRSPRNEVARFILSDLDLAIQNLYDRSTFNGQRVNKQVAQLFKSRVALFEATFEKYHKGSGRVPGDANWPGAKMSYNQGKTFNIDAEVKFFLQEAMASAKAVGDKAELTTNNHTIQPKVGTITGWNPYFELFSQPSLANVPEVLLWRQYSSALSISHDATYRTKTGCNDGFTRVFTESFLMKNGLPIYAAGSAYAGDKTIDAVKKDRDERLQLFVWGESTLLESAPNAQRRGAVYSEPDSVQNHITNSEAQLRCISGYQPRKYYTYDYNQTMNDELKGTNACPIFRTAEALLNYIEACYELNGSLDATAQGYWQSLRERAGVSTNYQATIDATDLSKEGDFGVYSGTTAVSKMLYNIRRERMNELFSEGLRFQDLIRWRSFDRMITTKWIPEGVNFWEAMYKTYIDKKGNEPKSDGSAEALVSSRTLGKYLRPYSRSMQASNELKDGYKWHEAYYLNPIGIGDLQTASPDRSTANSNLYQNPYWPVVAGGHAEK